MGRVFRSFAAVAAIGIGLASAAVAAFSAIDVITHTNYLQVDQAMIIGAAALTALFIVGIFNMRVEPPRRPTFGRSWFAGNDYLVASGNLQRRRDPGWR